MTETPQMYMDERKIWKLYNENKDIVDEAVSKLHGGSCLFVDFYQTEVKIVRDDTGDHLRYNNNIELSLKLNRKDVGVVELALERCIEDAIKLGDLRRV